MRIKWLVGSCALALTLSMTSLLAAKSDVADAAMRGVIAYDGLADTSVVVKSPSGKSIQSIVRPGSIDRRVVISTRPRFVLMPVREPL